MEIGIVIGIVVLIGCVLLAVAHLQRRSPCYSPGQSNPTVSKSCDICGRGHRDNELSVAIGRHDYQLFQAMIYKKNITVHVCDSCLKNIRVRTFVIIFALAFFALTLAVPFVTLKAFGSEADSFTLIITGVISSLVLSAVLFFIWHKIPSLRDTWQMKDLCKDGWFVRGYAVMRGNHAIVQKRVFCVIFFLAVFAGFVYFVFKAFVR